ncbi:transmembrane component BioN of energizing module of biotin ECF transporter [Cystobacter fuscus]|uniref:Transmembrane component BioN of energizing module of biotin ECF transporter n=1 Tax=Cystobacter fuscus TaxID=43 RepID=A0A250JBZ3_9BACT|nr:energy-coupling factor transporter transmembrane protein EcfT [Cystobacter fuscus]ATB40696.1 transmembrane component BioN of energizing module of biotin ECF transporter [Cystobacter fuscus]
MSLGLYVHRASPVHSTPAGAKMLGLLGAAITLLLFSSPPVLAAALATTLGLYALARLGPRELAFLLPLSAWVLLPLFVLQGVLSGWDTATRAVLRLAVLVLLAMLVSLTTRASDQLDTLQRALRPLARFGVSPARLGLLLALTLRFIPLVATWVHEVREAQRARGLEHHPLAVLVPLLVKTLRTADALAEAIDARGFDAEDPS